jgi:hypothetical protein
MGTQVWGLCPSCTAMATSAMATGIVYFGYTHRFHHDELPDTEIHRAVSEPSVRAITTTNETITPSTGSLTFNSVSSISNGFVTGSS